jgi:hypothetical protein
VLRPSPSLLRRALLGVLAVSTAGGVVVGLAWALRAGAPGVAHGTSWSAQELGIEVSRELDDGEPSEGGAVVPAPGSTEPDADDVHTEALPPQGSYIAPTERLGLAGCQLFPRDNAFHASIARLPVHPRSDAMVAAGGGAGLTLNAGFSARPWQGSRPGYPVNIADSRRSELVDVIGRQYASTSDLAGHPVPTAPRFEGWPSLTWDQHLLVVDPATCTSHEMIGVSPPGDNPVGAWFVDKAVKIDLGSNEYRHRGAVKVAGVSMLAGLVRYDEVASGNVDHVISMSLPSASPAHVWPARASDGTNPDPDAPPMGTWLRLRADVDLSQFGPQAATIARALRDHGGVLADTGARFALSGEPDVRWDDADLRGLRSLSLASFEVVDPSPMMVSRDSLQIR